MRRSTKEEFRKQMYDQLKKKLSSQSSFKKKIVKIYIPKPPHTILILILINYNQYIRFWGKVGNSNRFYEKEITFWFL